MITEVSGVQTSEFDLCIRPDGTGQLVHDPSHSAFGLDARATKRVALVLDGRSDAEFDAFLARVCSRPQLRTEIGWGRFVIPLPITAQRWIAARPGAIQATCIAAIVVWLLTSLALGTAGGGTVGQLTLGRLQSSDVLLAAVLLVLGTLLHELSHLLAIWHSRTVSSHFLVELFPMPRVGVGVTRVVDSDVVKVALAGPAASGLWGSALLVAAFGGYAPQAMTLAAIGCALGLLDSLLPLAGSDGRLALEATRGERRRDRRHIVGVSLAARAVAGVTIAILLTRVVEW